MYYRRAAFTVHLEVIYEIEVGTMPLDDDIGLPNLTPHTVVAKDTSAHVSLSMVAENMLRVLSDPAFVIELPHRIRCICIPYGILLSACALETYAIGKLSKTHCLSLFWITPSRASVCNT